MVHLDEHRFDVAGGRRFVVAHERGQSCLVWTDDCTLGGEAIFVNGAVAAKASSVMWGRTKPCAKRA